MEDALYSSELDNIPGDTPNLEHAHADQIAKGRSRLNIITFDPPPPWRKELIGHAAGMENRGCYQLYEDRKHTTLSSSLRRASDKVIDRLNGLRAGQQGDTADERQHSRANSYSTSDGLATTTTTSSNSGSKNATPAGSSSVNTTPAGSSSGNLDHADHSQSVDSKSSTK